MNTDLLPDAVAEYLAENRAQLHEFTERLVGFNTQNPPGRTTAVVDWLESTLDEDGLESERIAVDPEKPNLLVTLPGASDRTLCLNGHVDTVPFAESDWSRDPLGERVEDRLYGRGTTDMKGPVAAMVQVALAYARTGTEPPVTVKFALVSDEETGGDAGLRTLLETTPFEPDACVVGETTSRNGRYSVSVADRGNIWLTVEASSTAAHSSRPMIGVNAIDRLTGAVKQLRTEFGEREHPDQWLAFDEAIFEALWVDGRDIGDADVLADLAESAGVDGAEIREAIDDEDLRSDLREQFQAAQEQDITGVPTFVYSEHAARGAVPPEHLQRLVEGT